VFCCFVGYDEGKLAAKMECKLCGSYFWKEISRRILGKQRNEMKRRIFDVD
jgi:hypothetical protein